LAVHVDFFDFFRWVLGTVVTIYATVVTFQSAYSWWVYLGSEGKYFSLIRRYIMLQGLRLRFTTFGGDALICILLTIVWVLLVEAHTLVGRIDPWIHVHHAGTHVTTR
jgi:hypothetical protein